MIITIIIIIIIIIIDVAGRREHSGGEGNSTVHLREETATEFAQ
jgi:hypothetical protein